MRRHPRPTAFQQTKQDIINWLLALGIEDVILIVGIIAIVVLMIIAVHLQLTNGGCAEGYVYMRGVCVQGYKP